MTFKDRIKVTSTSTGIGTFTLGSPVTGYIAFTDGVYKYCIVNATETEWEVGEGSVTSGVLTRTTIEASSNNNLIVNFSAGTKQVFNTVSATYISSLVPYTGATASLNLGAYNLTATQIIKAGGLATQFLKADGSVDSTTYMNRAVYDTDADGIVDAAMAMRTIGRNATGSTLYKGTVVYISGSTGNRPNFVKAQANSEATSAGTFGVVYADIANNADGYVVTIGTIDTLDTRTTATNPFTSVTLADGDTVYLDPNTAGFITNVKPSAPNHLVYVGKVTRTSPTNGTIVYRIQNGAELNEIHDVSITSVANNDVLVYESATTLWKNKSIATILGYTPQAAITLTTTGSSGAATFVSNTLNIPTVTLAGLGGISLTSISASSPINYNNTTGVFSIQVANTSQNGYLSFTDWNTFNGKQGTLTLTTTGTSGAATLIGNTLNIPQYGGGVTGSGTAGQVTYWTGSSAVGGSSTFTYTPTTALVINNTVAASGAIARGVNLTPTLTAAANNDVLVGLDVTPTFTNGAFTGVTNLAARFGSTIRVTGNVQSTTGVFEPTTVSSVGIDGSSASRGVSTFGVNTNGNALVVNDVDGAKWILLTGGYDLTFAKHISTSNSYRSSLVLEGDAATNDPQGFTAYTGTSAKMKLFSSGNLLIQNGGTFTDAGYRLDINGTGASTGALRVTGGNVQFGSSTGLNWDNTNGRLGIGTSSPGVMLDVVNGNTTVTYNRNDFARILLSNPNAGSSAFATVEITSDAAAGGFQFGKYSSTKLSYAGVNAKDGFLFNYGYGDLVFANTAAGSIKFMANGSTTAQLVLTTNGYLAIGQTSATAYADIVASTTSAASLRIRSGTAPTSPNNGDIWQDGTNIKIFIGGTTKTFTLI